MINRFALLLLITFLANPVFSGKAPTSTPELIAKGQASYVANCAVCHGDKGDGNGPAGASLSPKARNFITEKFKYGSKPEQVYKTISEGAKDTAMMAFAHLPEDERWALTYFVLSLVKK
jgi:mono/diheme cytochrome c family protein